MKFLVGDDNGIVKRVRVEAQKVEKLGPTRRGDEVQRLAWAGTASDREACFAAAFASGLIEARKADDGRVLWSLPVATDVRRLEPIGDGLLSISYCGSAAVVKNWSDAVASAGEGCSSSEPVLQSFSLPAPVADAHLDPAAGAAAQPRLLFGGGDNDVKVYDVHRESVVWRAKNVRENTLCLRVPVRVSALRWATGLPGGRSLAVCGSSDGKIRVYDTATQRRPLFELVVGYKTGGGSGGWTGVEDDTPRPTSCAEVASMGSGDRWSLFTANTVGMIREYDLRNLSECQAAKVPPGRKAHRIWATRQMPVRGGYGGVMGAIRSLDVHRSGEAMVAVGLGRYAYVYETRRRQALAKVYLKQKLNTVIFSEEAREKKDQDSDQEDGEEEGAGDEDGEDEDAGDEVDEGEEEECADEEAEEEEDETADAARPAKRRSGVVAEAARQRAAQDAAPPPVAADDEVVEGFSDDEEGAAAGQGEAAAGPRRKRRGAKRRKTAQQA